MNHKQNRGPIGPRVFQIIRLQNTVKCKREKTSFLRVVFNDTVYGRNWTQQLCYTNSVSGIIVHPCPLSSTYENRSPFGLLNGVLLSYLLFSNTLSDSVAGA